MVSYIKEFYRFLKHLRNNYKLLLILAYNDFREEYLGSYLGIIWAIIRPSAFIFVIWLVFTYGIKPGAGITSSSMILFLLTGMVPWFFFSEALVKSCNSIVENEFLVKKVAFSVNILPFVSILSCLIIHLILLSLVIFIVILSGYYPDLYWLQIPFYVFCSIMLLLGLGWLISAIRVFVKDIGEVVGLIVQFGFWFTPVFWSPDKVPERFRFILDLNPMAYIIQGFRDSLINKVWFWDHGIATIIFIIMLSFVLFLGALAFKRLTPHFGDVI